MPQDRSIATIVGKHGWFIALFTASDYLPSFAYTIGLWQKFKHPEIIAFGLTTETLGSILNIAGDKVKSGELINTNQLSDDFFENGSTQFVKVHEESLKDYFGYGLEYYDYEVFPALQMVWTDRNNKFPWDDDFEEEFKIKQPLLDRNHDFKFREKRNLGVYTNRHFLEDGKPILLVTHEDDGDWQFLTGDIVDSSDVRLVALEEMVKMDKTLNAVFNLEYGQRAERDSIGMDWSRDYIEE